MEQIAILHILGSTLGLIILLWAAAQVSAWTRPQRTCTEKLTTYESGSEPMGHARGPVNSRLYTIGLIFLLFEVETILLFPWALVWAGKDREQLGDIPWSLYMAVVGTFFILVLGLGLAYVLSKWKHIGIDSISATEEHLKTRPINPIPGAYYEQINEKYAGHRPKPTIKPTN